MATSMTGTSAVYQNLSQPVPSGMRCVICVGDQHLEEKIKAAILQNRGMVVVGFACDWPQCELLINQYCPELLVVAETVFLARCLSEERWPLVLKVTSECLGPLDAATVRADSPPDALQTAFRRMQARIIDQKSVELRELLSTYLETTAKRYRDAFRVLDLNTIREVDVDDVMFISVEGNYAVLNTALGVFRFRETLNNLVESLDPGRFVRIHRSAIVNLSAVERFFEGPGGASVLLRNGTRLQVGPTFKSLEGWPP